MTANSSFHQTRFERAGELGRLVAQEPERMGSIFLLLRIGRGTVVCAIGSQANRTV